MNAGAIRMKNDGKRFEKLVHEYYLSIKNMLGSVGNITLNSIVEGPDGHRQCDITIEHDSLGTKYRTLIECKDHSKPIKVEVVDAFTSKLGDLKFNKGIIVSRSGFQAGAISKATRFGIDLYSFNEVSKVASGINKNMPVLHLVMDITHLDIVFDVYPDFVLPLYGLSPGFATEVDMDGFLCTYFRPDYRLLKGKGYKRIKPLMPLSMQSMTMPVEGCYLIQDHALSNIDAYASYDTVAYLGRLDDVSQYFVKKNEVDGSEELHIPPDQIARLHGELPFFADTGDVPRYLFEGGIVTYSLVLEQVLKRKGLFPLDKIRETFELNFGGLNKPSGQWVAHFKEPDLSVSEQIENET